MLQHQYKTITCEEFSRSWCLLAAYEGKQELKLCSFSSCRKVANSLTDLKHTKSVTSHLATIYTLIHCSNNLREQYFTREMLYRF